MAPEFSPEGYGAKSKHSYLCSNNIITPNCMESYLNEILMLDECPNSRISDKHIFVINLDEIG